MVLNEGNTLQQEIPPQWFLQYLAEQNRRQEDDKQRLCQQEQETQRKLLEKEQKQISNGNKPGKSLPAIQEFHGELNGLDPWLQQTRVKIRVDYDSCTEYVKFWALAGCLRGKALRRMDAWTRQFGTPELASADTFFSRVEFVFQDPQSKERASRKLASLRQGNRPFLEAYMDWQGYLIEAGGADWPDSAKKISLDRILSDELVRAMISVPTSSDFEIYCNTLKEVDDKLRVYKSRQMFMSQSSRVSVRPSTSTPQPREHAQVPYAEESTSKQESLTWRKASPSPEAMDWQPTTKVGTSKPRRAQWVDKQELDRRREQRLCLRCGDSEHFARDCPYLAPSRPRQVKVAKRREGPQLEADEDDHVPAESENE
jgi:hypothetical protein